jgi:hypothetical protein
MLPLRDRSTQIKTTGGVPVPVHAVTLKLAKHNQQLMRDYLELAARIPVFRLTYRRSFEGIEEVFDALEDHLRSAAMPSPQVEIASVPV